MPYKDPEMRRASVREAVQRHRAAISDACKPSRKPLPELEELRFQTAQDVVVLLNGQIETLLCDQELGSLPRARGIGYLASLLLRAIETGSLEERIEALEQVLGA